MALESIGTLSAEAIKLLKEARLLMVVRGSEVMVETVDKGKALDILKTVKNPVEQVYRFHGYTIRVPKETLIEARWYGYVNNPVGRKGKLHIHECSKPANGLDPNDKTHNLSKVRVKGVEINLNTIAFDPAYAGVVMCDDDGEPLFEITPWNIYVLFDPKPNPEATKRIYEQQMLMFAIILANHSNVESQTIYQKIWDQQGKEREKFELRMFEDMMSGAIKKELKQLETNATQHEARVKDYQQALFKEERAHTDTLIRLDAFKMTMGKDMAQKAKEEWEKLKGLERNGAVRNLRVTEQQIGFITRKIKWSPKKLPYEASCYDDGTQRPLTITEPVVLGEFEVTVHLGASFGIEITNLTKTLSYGGYVWHHPHVREGNLCKGNMTEALPTFAARREFEAVVMCCLKWLENVDVLDPWGKGIYYWIKDFEKTKPKEEKKSDPPQPEPVAVSASSPVPAAAVPDIYRTV